MFNEGMKLVDIARELGISADKVRRWKSTQKWGKEIKENESDRSDSQKAIDRKKQSKKIGNKNAVGHGAPRKNKNAEKHGFFSRYLPEETFSIIQELEQKDPLDILWENIQIAYAAIIRAQKIMYVRDRDDKTVEKIEEKFGDVMGEKWEVQQAWDKQANFLKAQARAQGELRSLIKQYEELLHKNLELATEEQKARIAYIKAQTDKITGEDKGNSVADDWIEEVMKADEEEQDG
uniref:Small Terminase n=1 Tax=Siphoviridae sp. ctdjo3 TaxID=2825583 RepID=A0A8S5PU87_9CAUD|nr:MAG TPA: Small Terminase [Siphoviridae sp. ctdjo3]